MWYALTIKEIQRKLGTNIERGLNSEEAKRRLKQYGENKLAEKKKTGIVVRFFNQFKDFMIIVLIIAAIISAVLSYVQGTNEYVDSFIIVAIVIINAIMGVMQEYKAEKSLEALKEMSAPTCNVKRDGQINKIESKMLVPGDIVYLEAGSYVPADIRLIEAYNLKVEESALTR